MPNDANTHSHPTLPVIDPTTNVLALVEAAVKRLDDLRDAESRRVNELMILRADHANELRDAESKRLDAIRVVDVNAVSIATERATTQASVLAKQVEATAEMLRNLVATTAATMATQLASLTTSLTDRIGKLEVSKYEQQGRKGLSTPIIVAIATVGGGVLGFLVQMLFKAVAHFTGG